MAKSKTQTKPVKASAVTKSAPAVKAKAVKESSKKVDKKAKKVESSDEESDDDSASSASEDSSASDDESVEEKTKPVANGKANGKAKVEVDSDDSDDSEDSDESDDDAKPVTNGNKKAVNKKAAAEESSDESDSSEDDSEEKTKPKAKAAESSDQDSDDSEDSDESEEEEEAEKSVSKKRKAEDAAPPQAKKQKAETNGNETKNLFVGSLSWNVDDAYLRQEFEKFGEIIRANVVTDRDSGRSKGFGYVEFTNLDDAIKAHTEMTGAEIDGRAINVDYSQPRGDNNNNGQRQQQRAKQYGDQPSEPSDTLFVGNLSFEADESVVGEAFAGYDGLKHIRLPTRPEDGTPKGFGYVQFNSVEEAQAAHDGMSGAFISGRPIRLDYSQPRQNNDSPRGGFGDRGGRGRGRGRGGFGDRGGRGRGGFGDRGGRGGGRGGSTNRGGFGSFQGKKMTF